MPIFVYIASDLLKKKNVFIGIETIYIQYTLYIYTIIYIKIKNIFVLFKYLSTCTKNVYGWRKHCNDWNRYCNVNQKKKKFSYNKIMYTFQLRIYRNQQKLRKIICFSYRTEESLQVYCTYIV